MKVNNKIYKLIITLLITAIYCPVTVYAADGFWGEEQDAKPVQEAPAALSAQKNEKILKDVEIHGLNVLSPDLIKDKIHLKAGDTYNRNTVQADLRSIYETGYFSEKMRAIPVNNPDGTVTLKLILEENAPVTDFTIEGNTVVSTEEILTPLLEMKGKPQNIAQLNDAISKIQNIYTSKGYILARVSSVTDDPDGTVNIEIKEGTINSIAISGLSLIHI